jgi:hypothetical protein
MKLLNNFLYHNSCNFFLLSYVFTWSVFDEYLLPVNLDWTVDTAEHVANNIL